MGFSQVNIFHFLSFFVSFIHKWSLLSLSMFQVFLSVFSFHSTACTFPCTSIVITGRRCCINRKEKCKIFITWFFIYYLFFVNNRQHNKTSFLLQKFKKKILNSRNYESWMFLFYVFNSINASRNEYYTKFTKFLSNRSKHS